MAITDASRRESNYFLFSSKYFLNCPVSQNSLIELRKLTVSLSYRPHVPPGRVGWFRNRRRYFPKLYIKNPLIGPSILRGPMSHDIDKSIYNLFYIQFFSTFDIPNRLTMQTQVAMQTKNTRHLFQSLASTGKDISGSQEIWTILMTPNSTPGCLKPKNS